MQNEKKLICKENLVKAMVILYGVIMGLLHFVRIFDQNFWGDEGFSIRLAKMDFITMLKATAEDVHPPLYYAILQLCCRIFGYDGAVYHFASLLPFLLAIFVVLKVVWKKFGTEAAVVMLTLMALSENALTYNVEVRMYSWGALFILISFLAMYDILTENKKQAYVVFSVSTLLAAYTHYFALLSVAFFYVFLIGVALYKRKEYFKRVATVCVMAVVVYMPWFIVLLTTMFRTQKDFWMLYIPYLKECIAFVFGSKLGILWFALLCIAAFIAIWNQKKQLGIPLWFASGFFAVIGTILAGNLISRFFRPIFLVRYMYPVTIVAWLMLAVAISFGKYKKIYAMVVVALLLATGVPGYIEHVSAERADEEQLFYTLEQTKDVQSEGNVILTNLTYIEWTLADIYYPETECIVIESWDEMPILDPKKTYWLYWWNPLTDNEFARISQLGISCETVMEDGSIGTHVAAIYKLSKTEENSSR